MTALIDRIKALSTSAITWLMGAAMLVTMFAKPIADQLPGDYGQSVIMWSVRIVGWIGGAVLVLRRIVELPKGTRGVLIDTMPEATDGGG